MPDWVTQEVIAAIFGVVAEMGADGVKKGGKLFFDKINTLLRHVPFIEQHVSEKNIQKVVDFVRWMPSDQCATKETFEAFFREKMVDYLKFREKVEQHYDDVEKIFEEEEESIVGSESLEKVYIKAYYSIDDKTVAPILEYIKNWYEQNPYGVILLHGEPGHGKTTFCQKAVYDFCKKDRLDSCMQNVLWFRLNPAYSYIIDRNNQKLVLQNAFCFDRDGETISADYCRDSLVFLDGYDELKLEAASKTNVKTFPQFYQIVRELARQKNIYFVITARTTSVIDEVKNTNITALKFAPMTEAQQNEWMDSNCPDYKETFYRVQDDFRRKSEREYEILAIPIIFRMVCNCRFDGKVSGVVELYNKLFRASMERRGVYQTDELHQRYEGHAYQIFLFDEDTAIMSDENERSEVIYAYYLYDNKRQVGFVHRSFYQYFLACYLYHKLAAVTDDESAEEFLCCLAERRIDNDILRYIQQVHKMERDTRVSKACQMVIDTIERTDAIVPGALETSRDGNGIKTRFDRCGNVFYNAVNVCNFLKHIMKVGENPRACSLLSRYNCDGIWLIDADLIGANLSRAYLIGAYLIGADLSEADLIGTDLSGAYLREAYLIGAYLIGADLSRAYLGGAYLGGADLSEADLSGADLSEADLREADLSEAHLRGANLSGARLSGAHLSRADLSGAYLSGVDLRFAKHLDSVDLNRVETLENCKILLRDKDTLKLDNPDAYGIIWCDDDGHPIEES